MVLYTIMISKKLGTRYEAKTVHSRTAQQKTETCHSAEQMLPLQK